MAMLKKWTSTLAVAVIAALQTTVGICGPMGCGLPQAEPACCCVGIEPGTPCPMEAEDCGDLAPAPDHDAVLLAPASSPNPIFAVLSRLTVLQPTHSVSPHFPAISALHPRAPDGSPPAVRAPPASLSLPA